MGNTFSKVTRYIIAISLIAIFTLSIGIPLATAFSTRTNSLVTNAWKVKVSSLLLNNKKVYSPYYGLKFVSEINKVVPSFLFKRIAGPPTDLARVKILVYGGERQIAQVTHLLTRTTSIARLGDYSIVFGLATKKQVEAIAKLPFVAYVAPQRSILDVIQPRYPKFEGISKLHTFTSNSTAGSGYPMYSAPMLIGAEEVWKEYGINGSGVKIGIVDTGVDFGSPDLGVNKIARASDGLPLIFDADMIGFILTINPTKRINSTTIYVPGWYKGHLVFFNPTNGNLYAGDYAFVIGVNAVTGASNITYVKVANRTFTVPSYIKGNIKFGLGIQLYEIEYPRWAPNSVFVFEIAAPVIVADTNGDGTYDTVYVDLSTTYYLFRVVLYNLTDGAMPLPNKKLLDFSFADEPAVGYGHEVAARDFTGDGVPDFSFGALAGAVYDYWGLFFKNYYQDWRSDWEPSTGIIPGLDAKNGNWVDFVYDFYGHGTECAHVAAASGKVVRPIVGVGGKWNVTLPGIAPGAKLGAAPALFEGDVVTAELWLSGFDLVNPKTYTWVYTGKHKVDIISNSWGDSWLLYNGYANDADPTSLWEDYIMATSGVVIVHAAGNGGPGWGSVTFPAAATLPITVAASTDFFYRPFFGLSPKISYLPGGHFEIISWSDRGPTEFGYPKPDVADIGSFEWAGERAIDSPLNGVYAFDLFGGTSEATPMTAGAVALIIQALRVAGINYTPYLVKAILKSTADDTGFNAYAQGSGQVDVYRAVSLILHGGIIAYSKDSVQNVLKLYDETLAAMLRTSVSNVSKIFSGAYDTAIYPGPMLPGETKTVNLTLRTIGTGTWKASISDYTLVKTFSEPLAAVLNVNKGSAFLPSSSSPSGVEIYPAKKFLTPSLDGKIYMNIANSPAGLRIAIPLSGNLLKHKFIEVNIAYPLYYAFAPDTKDPYGRPDLSKLAIFMGFELGVWFDLNNNGKIDWYMGHYEVSRLQYDIREGPVAHLEIGNPMEQIEMAAEAVSMYTGINPEYLIKHAKLVVEIRLFVNGWYGSNVPPMPISGDVEAFDPEPSPFIASYPTSVTVKGETTVPITITVPKNTLPGVYEAYIVVNSSSGKTLVPVSIPVAMPVNPEQRIVTLMGTRQPYVYDNYGFRGALDQSWRPEVGDWRVYPIAIPADKAFYSSSVMVTVTWSYLYSDYDAGLIGPGINYWGVMNTSYVAYVDAAVLGAKLTIPFSVVNLPGVYGYFDYPAPGIAQFTAPLDSLRPFITGEKYVFYWLVVHQKFSDRISETPIITLYFGRSVKEPYLNVPKNSMIRSIYSYLGVDVGPTESEGAYVVPLEGQSHPIAVKLITNNVGTGMIKFYKYVLSTENADLGPYLVVFPTVDWGTPAVIWGLTIHGKTSSTMWVPLTYTPGFIVNVTG